MSIFDGFIDKIRSGLKDDIQDLMKADADSLPEKPQELNSHNESVAPKAILSDPYFEQATQHFIQKTKMSRISNKTLKDVSLRDWLVSAIIQGRVDTMLRFSRPEHKRFEMGFRVVKRDVNAHYSEEDNEICRQLEDFLYHCGRTKDVIPGQEMLFGEFLKLTLRDAMTFGHVAIEKVLNRKGALHHFRPVPAESTYRINQMTSREIVEREVEASRRHYMERLKRLTNDPGAMANPADRELAYFKYVQMSYDNRVLAAFGDEDMIFKLFNAQNFPDSQGYCYVPDTAYVTMADGSLKLIEDLTVGDIVFTHDGTIKPVTEKKMRNLDNQEVCLIYPNGMIAHEITPEHPMLVLNKKNRRSWEHSGKVLEPQWIPAKDIKKGDYLVIPKLFFAEDFTTIDMAKYGDLLDDGTVTANKSQNCPQQHVNRYIEVDGDLGWLLGLYLGDGCSMQKGCTVRFDLGIHETDLVDKLTKVLKQKFNLNVTVRSEPERNYTGVFVGCSVFSRMLADLCPGNTYSKSINECLLRSPKSCRWGIIGGHIDSDGTVYSSGDSAASSKSHNLISSLAILTNSLGYLAKIKKYSHRSGYATDDNHKPSYRIQYPRCFVRATISSNKANKVSGDSYKKHYRECENNFYVSISKVSTKLYTGPVYNIEVEDNHSYLANQVVSHNCYGPLELAIINITNHLNVESYNANFFTHGFAARGLLHLKGTVTQSQLTGFRRQFYNSISGTQHAWRTPIIAGLDDVQWIQMSGSAKEMEYINFNHHLMRTICTQFQIDPVELGLDFLTNPSGRSASQQANNEYKINYSRERGLYPILMFFEDLVNCDILPALDKKLASEYMFKFIGYSDETPQTNVALLQAEMTVHRSMNDLLREAKKEPINHPVGDMPLNAQFWGLAEKNMTRGEIRATFFGDKEAIGKPELAYIPADPGFIAWNQLVMTRDRMKKQDKQQAEAIKQQQEQQDKENQLNEAQHSRDQEKHNAEMTEVKSRHAHAAVTGGQSLYDTAKEVGAASKPLEVGGQKIANPINTMDEK